MVRSVERVVDLLQSHMKLNINMTSADVLRLNCKYLFTATVSYLMIGLDIVDEGNIHLRNGEVDLAIDCYDQALALGDKEQEGVLLVMRGTALLQRAYACR